MLLHAADHGTAGRLVAEYANEAGATTILIGAPTNHGLSALMDASASAELRRHAKAKVLVIDPDVPAGMASRRGSRRLLKPLCGGPGTPARAVPAAVKKEPSWQPFVKSATAPLRQHAGERLDAGVERVGVAGRDADRHPGQRGACVTASSAAKSAADAYAPAFAARAWRSRSRSPG